MNNRMYFNGQKVLPAIRNMKYFEPLLKSNMGYIILLESHIAQLRSIADYLKKANKELLIDIDLIHGLKNDEYAVQYLIQEIQPTGIISTKSQVIKEAKKKGIMAIQRLFLLDSNALETNYKHLEKNKPDYIEVMPGVIPHMITEIRERTNIPILAGGLVRKQEEVEEALNAGAIAISTSNPDLWNLNSKF